MDVDIHVPTERFYMWSDIPSRSKIYDMETFSPKCGNSGMLIVLP